MAAAPGDDTAAIWQAAGVLGLSARAAAPAVAAGILDRGQAAAFRHPLIRSAVYAAADDEQRRRIHTALAVTSDPDRRAWHLAEATTGVDDQAATALEAASLRARARGGYSAQALFLSRAAELTAQPARRADRYLAAAQAHLTTGDPAAVLRLLDLATPDLRGPAERARALQIRACVEMFNTRVDRVPLMLLDAAAELGAADARLTWELLSEAMHAAIIGADRLEHTTLAEVAKVTADAWHDRALPDVSPDLLMAGLARRLAHGYAQGAPVIHAALSRLRAAEELRERYSPLSVIVSIAADEVWDTEGKAEIVQRLAAVDRGSGALYGLVLSLIVLATCDVYDGLFAAAEARYAEADEYAAATGFSAHGKINRALLYAWTGKESELRAAAIMMNGLAERCGLGALAYHASHALCVLDLARGNYQEALAHAIPAFVEDIPPIANLVLPLLIEAAVRVGDRHHAAAALERIEERAPLAGTPWALGILAQCRALMSEKEDTEALYLESIELLGQVPMALERARSRLLLGEWLRRRKRRAEARVQLRAAHESFESWGAAAFAERARVELLATGETARQRTVQTLHHLTPRERHVASLAASGLTNAAIASRLFVTTSTIEFHLNKVFRKLRITTRSQIAPALSQGTSKHEQ
jgi:DNA-binding CsgD family transcriptional regulator